MLRSWRKKVFSWLLFVIICVAAVFGPFSKDTYADSPTWLDGGESKYTIIDPSFQMRSVPGNINCENRNENLKFTGFWNGLLLLGNVPVSACFTDTSFGTFATFGGISPFGNAGNSGYIRFGNLGGVFSYDSSRLWAIPTLTRQFRTTIASCSCMKILIKS